MAFAASLVVAACGGDDSGSSVTTAGESAEQTTGSAGTTDSAAPGDTDSASTTAAADEGTPDENGVLQLGDFLANPAYTPNFDPALLKSSPQAKYLFYTYDSLLHQAVDKSYSPGLAQSATIVDSSTITVTLKPNLKFQDDTPLDAEAVKSTILRNKDAQNLYSMRAPELQSVASIDVTSPTELTIHLDKPIAGAWYNLLAQNETMPVSPTAVANGTDLDANPVGAGPFKLVSKTNQKIRLEKWDGFYDAANVHLAAVEIVDVGSAEGQINAFQTGVVDFGVLSVTDYQQLSGAPIKADVSVPERPGFIWLQLACNKNPDVLGDVKVRQALLYATDRQAISDVVYDGKAAIQSQFVSEKDPLYNPALADLYPHDVDKAKELLAEAGKSDLTVTTVQPTDSTSTRVLEILQQQWADAGITLKFEASNDVVTDFYVNGKIQSVFNPAGSGTFSGSDLFSRLFTPTSFGGTCTSTDPKFQQDFDALQALDPASPEAAKLYQSLSAILLDEARYVPVVSPPIAIVWNERLGKLTLRPNVQGVLVPDAVGTYIAAS